MKIKELHIVEYISIQSFLLKLNLKTIFTHTVCEIHEWQ